MDAGLNPNVGSVASVFVSRWDAAVKDTAPASLRNRLGIAIAMRTYKAARDLLTSPQWQRVTTPEPGLSDSCGRARAQKIPRPPTFCTSERWRRPYTVNTMPEGTLNALAKYHSLGSILPPDGGDCEEVLARFT